MRAASVVSFECRASASLKIYLWEFQVRVPRYLTFYLTSANRSRVGARTRLTFAEDFCNHQQRSSSLPTLTPAISNKTCAFLDFRDYGL